MQFFSVNARVIELTKNIQKAPFFRFCCYDLTPELLFNVYIVWLIFNEVALLEYQRRMQTTETIKGLLTAVAAKRRADRMMGLYTALESRSKERVKQGVSSAEEQIAFLEKTAATQGELDAANAAIEASRLALIGQCRPEVEEEVNGYILREIGQ